MQISKIQQNAPSFGLKMTQRYIKQEAKRLKCKQKDILKSDLSKFMNDNVVLDCKNSKYMVVLPKYKVGCYFKATNDYPLINIAQAEYACIRKIMLDSIEKKKIATTTKELMKNFPWDKTRITEFLQNEQFARMLQK